MNVTLVTVEKRKIASLKDQYIISELQNYRK